MYLFEFDAKNKEEFAQKSLNEMKREPSLFYLIRSNSENGNKFRSAVVAAICTLLDNCELIQKWQGHLETAKSDSAVRPTSDPLGQFLRLLHYALIVMLESETDSQMMIAHIKLANTLLHVTPYAKMLPGLASLLVHSLVDLLFKQTAVKFKSKYSVIAASLINSLVTAFSATIAQDVIIKHEINSSFISVDHNLINLLIDADFLAAPTEIAEPALSLLSKLASAFPNSMT